MPYEFKITRSVEFSETDAAGIMHFSNFFRYMEAAEHAFFRSLGFSVARSRNGLELCLPRVHAECDYAVPLRFEDEVLVRLLVERKGRRSLTYQFRFSRLSGDNLKEVARGRLTVASVERQANGTFKPVPLPRAIAEKIEQAPPQLLREGILPAATSSAPVTGPDHKRTKRNVHPLARKDRPAAIAASLRRRSARLRLRVAKVLPALNGASTATLHRRD